MKIENRNMASSAPLHPNEGSLPLMIHVTAPATLPAGYAFEAEINGDPEKVFTCLVVSRFQIMNIVK